MRGQIFNGRSFGAFFYNVPDDALRYAASPGLASAANAPEDAAFAHTGGQEPCIDCVLDPVRNGHRPDMPCLADQIDDGPVIVPPLKMGKIQFCGLFPAQPAAQEHPEQRSIPLAFERIRFRHLPERSCLVGREPVSKKNTEVLRPFDAPDASSKIRGE